MTRRATLAGLGIGFLGTVLIGGAVGAIVGLAYEGPDAALTVSLWGAAIAGVLCALPVAVLPMIECSLLALLLQRLEASPSSSKTAFIALGAVNGPLLALGAFVIFGLDFEVWVWAAAAVIATAGGARVGLVVWRIAALSHTRRWFVPVEEPHSPGTG